MMTRFTLLILILFILPIVYWMIVYNSIISNRNQIRRAFSGIDIQLKKRWDLIPNLVNTVKGYAAHEVELLERLVIARREVQRSSRSDILDHDRLKNEQDLAVECSRLMAVVESYPELDSSEQFIMLQRNLTEIESQIAAARRSYNAYVVRYNNKVESIPSSVVANIHIT